MSGIQMIQAIIIFFMISTSYLFFNNGCENKFALEKSLEELKNSSKILDESAIIIDDINLEKETIKIENFHKKMRQIDTDLKKVKMVLYWSKNIDLVLNNSRIQSKLKLQKNRLKLLTEDFNNLKINHAIIHSSVKDENESYEEEEYEDDDSGEEYEDENLNEEQYDE